MKIDQLKNIQYVQELLLELVSINVGALARVSPVHRQKKVVRKRLDSHIYRSFIVVQVCIWEAHYILNVRYRHTRVVNLATHGGLLAITSNRVGGLLMAGTGLYRHWR